MSSTLSGWKPAVTPVEAQAAIGTWNKHLGALREGITPQGTGRGVLQDLTISIKDVIDVEGWTVTCNHRPFADRRPVSDADIVSLLRKAGACFIGASTTLEFAYGGFTGGSLYPHARNPWDLGRSPGGSSAGAGAAVAAGLCDAAIATDTSGSVRGPAALCGILGLKFTHGSTSARGIFPLSETLDVAGVLARDPSIVARVASVLQKRPVASVAKPPERIGWLSEFDDAAGVEPEVAVAIQSALADFETAGAKVEPVRAQPLRLYHSACITILLYEAWRVHGTRLVGQPHGYAPRTWARLALGAFVPSMAYRAALRLRQTLRAEIDKLLQGYDLLATAAAVAPAGDPASSAPFGMLATPFVTTPFSLTGHPALAMPVGFSRDGLPLSIQLVAHRGAEADLLAAAAVHRGLRPWQSMTPTFQEEPHHAS